MTRPPSDRSLNDLADLLAEEFSDYRHSNGFNELSLVIDNSDPEHSTLIAYIDCQQPTNLAQHVEAFLRDHDVRIECERHSESDIRVLVIIE